MKGTIHRLFVVPDRDDVPESGDLTDNLNPESLVVLQGTPIEPSVADDPPGTRYRFERQGYFMSDPVDSEPGAPVFNRTGTLKATWAKIRQKSRA